MAHATDPHVEHTGHGGHHINSSRTLWMTFGGLVGLTILTVVLGLMERDGLLPLGPLSVPVALAIAGVKVFLVAAYFMGLKYDGGTNLLAFVGSLVFLAIFLTFTFLDTLFRDTFEEQSAVTVDQILADELDMRMESERMAPVFESVPLVEQPDSMLFRSAPVDPMSAAGGAPAAE